MLDTDAGADGGVDAEKPYVANIALLIPGGDGRPAAPDTDIGEVLDPKDATAGWDADDDLNAWVVLPSPLDPPSGI